MTPRICTAAVLLTFGFAALGPSRLPAAEAGKADVVLRNGKIYTADKGRSIDQALAFTGDTIVAVGADADVEKLIGSSTKVIDLAGKLVMPGLIDTHVHPIVGAINRAKCNLTGVKANIDALKPAIDACLAKKPGGTDDWFEAVQLDNYGFSATAKDLDRIQAVRPIALWGNDGHTVWVNSRGLELLAVTATTPDPTGGKIARDESGAPLDAFAAARAANGDKDNRHQIAHLQLVDPADFPRFKDLGVIANFQLEWGRREPATEGPLEPHLGPERYKYLYPAGSVHRAGATIAGGSDWDVSSFNPFRAFQVGVTRALGKEQMPLNIDERVPLKTAIDAYTINAAYAIKQDKTIGSLEVGKRADLIVVNRDILTIDPEKIGDTKVLLTYLDGRLVHSDASGSAEDDDEDQQPQCLVG